MSLSSLLVQRGVATIREIEEALARQVLYGGDLVTNLFEVSRIEEDSLMPVVAESYGLTAAPLGELPKPAGTALRIVAADVVQERTFVPLEADKTLVVAVAEPLSKEAEQELTFALALPIEQKIAPLFRIRQALARDYGIPIDKRIARLIQKVVSKGPSMASFLPPPLESQPNIRVPPRPPSMIPPPVVARSIEPPITTTTAQGTFVRNAAVNAPRPPRRRRGPLTLTVAIEELEASAERDVILDVLFEFARQFFDYTALFTVQGNTAEGRDAFGEGAPREKVARLAVPLDAESMLSSARRAKKPVRMKPATDALDPVLMADLGRDGLTECIVFPIVVRTRVVALILGDGGTTGIEDLGVRHVESLMDTAAGAFERVIVRRKLKGPEPAAETGTPGPVAGNVLAKKEETVAPPPTMMSEQPEHHLQPETRIAAEELAAPIREIMMEPPSKRNFIAPMAPSKPPENLPPAPAPFPVATPSANAPPLRDSIPTSTRDSMATSMRDSMPTSGHGTLGSEAPGRGESAPPSRSSPPRRRGTAPRLEFGLKAEPSVVSESKRPGPEGPIVHVHHALDHALDAPPPSIQEAPSIHEAVTAPPPPSSLAPTTMKDPSAVPVSPPITPPVSPPVSPPVHPWGADESDLSTAPHSPKAESPPPMRVAPITDMSPQPLLIGPISEAVPDYSENELATNVGRTTDMSQEPLVLPPSKPPPPVTMAEEAGTEGEPKTFVGATPLFDEEEKGSDLNRQILQNLDEGQNESAGEFPKFDPEATPVAPPVFETPLAPEVTGSEPLAATRMSEPALPLQHRKGQMPPKFAVKPMPASEEQISVGPHTPPSSHSDHSRVLPSVIVDVSTEYVDLVDRVIKADDEEAETQLLRAGGYAMPAIMQKFPGALTIEPDRLEQDPLPRVADCGPVLRLIASQRRTALPFVLAHVEAPDPESRFWATYLLTELVYPDAIDAAVARAFDEDEKVRRAARAAVHALAEAHPAPVVERLGEFTLAQTVELRIRAIEALAETREPTAVQVLLPLLDENQAEIAAATQKALIVLTRQDFGVEQDKWTQWWDQNKGRHRLEWLIDSLVHEHRKMRNQAGEELKWITKESFGYYDDLPRRERERAQKKFRDWWDQIGRVRFSRAATRGA